MSSTNLGHIGEPSNSGSNSLQVCGGHGVGDAIVVHDLNPTQLVVAGVHRTTQHLVESCVPGEDYVRGLHLDDTVAQSGDK